ncbi:MAG TPA: lysozyme inhibitor LprI family protein [Blastocatellia bacterium]|nr:lysozyme inhibitor LprI family protein [Blastocatellia bacterium]
MKRFGGNVLSILVVVLIGAAGVQPQTQTEMNRAACGVFRKADQELNQTYNQILRVYKDDPEFIAKLKTAQRAWVAFKEAHLESVFPKTRPGEYGSIQPVCSCQILAALTTERTAALRQWLTGIEEGDVCGGSIKSKDELHRLLKDGSK